MSRIRAKDTGPEMAVRRLVHAMGYRFRLHRNDLPGTPDIVFSGRRKIILVHGCFWHGHDCAEGVRRPKSNRAYWLPKIEKNQARDHQTILELEQLGWAVLILWGCELKSPELGTRIDEFLKL